jgi:hypothetical protein
MSKKGGDAPPPPDYTPIAEAARESSRYAYSVAMEQLDWAREQYGMDRELTDAVVDRFLDTQDQNSEAALKDRQRYERLYQPLEDKLAKDADEYSSPARRELETGRAMSAVAQQFEGARQTARNRLADFGVSPTSLRMAALDHGWEAQKAAAQAAAGNQAGEQTEATGRALRSEAINVGRGYPGQIAGAYGTSMGAGSGAVNANLGTTASGANTMGSPQQWGGLGNQGLDIWGKTLNMGYENQMDAWKASQPQGGSGVGQLAGTALGLVGSLMKFQDGGAVPDTSVGGAVPAMSSPTGGAAIDDVDARLNVGEFVIPKDVVSWLGEKAMHQMIEKSLKERQELPQRSGAIPDVGYAQPAPPTYQSAI